MQVFFAKIKIITISQIIIINYLKIHTYENKCSTFIAFNWHIFFSCNSTVKNQIIPISNIDTDFPVTEKLEFKPFNKFDIFERGFCMIDDSILWSVEENEENFGFCYDLNTGKKLS